MNIAEHTFPLPEIEAHKLDEVKEDLRQQPAIVRAKDYLRANPWWKLVFACVAGALAGAWFKNRA